MIQVLIVELGDQLDTNVLIEHIGIVYFRLRVPPKTDGD
jgi:hypothetical protein